MTATITETPTCPGCGRSLPTPTEHVRFLEAACKCGRRSEVRLVGRGFEVRPAGAQRRRPGVAFRDKVRSGNGG